MEYNHLISLRLAKESDFDSFYSIKSEKPDIYWGGHLSTPNKGRLYDFFKKHLDKDSFRRIYVVTLYDSEVIGYVYLDRIDEKRAEVSIGISEKFSGNGYGKLAICQCGGVAKQLGYKMLVAYIREDNMRSQNLFSHIGFSKTDIQISRCIENLNEKGILYMYMKRL